MIGKYKVISHKDPHKLHSNVLFCAAIKADRGNTPVIYLDAEDMGTTKHLVRAGILNPHRVAKLVNHDSRYLAQVRKRTENKHLLALRATRRLSVCDGTFFMDHLAQQTGAHHIGYDQQRCIHALFGDLAKIFQSKALKSPYGVLWVTWRALCNCKDETRHGLYSENLEYDERLRAHKILFNAYQGIRTKFEHDRSIIEGEFIPELYSKWHGAGNLICVGGNTTTQRGIHSSVFIVLPGQGHFTRQTLAQYAKVYSTYEKRNEIMNALALLGHDSINISHSLSFPDTLIENIK